VDEKRGELAGVDTLAELVRPLGPLGPLGISDIGYSIIGYSMRSGKEGGSDTPTQLYRARSRRWWGL